MLFFISCSFLSVLSKSKVFPSRRSTMALPPVQQKGAPPPWRGSAPFSAVAYFTIYRFDVSPPFSRFLRSLRRYPLLSNSFSARFTVLRDSRRSPAIRRIPGQHCRWLSIRSCKYIYTALARWGRSSSE